MGATATSNISWTLHCTQILNASLTLLRRPSITLRPQVSEAGRTHGSAIICSALSLVSLGRRTRRPKLNSTSGEEGLHSSRPTAQPKLAERFLPNQQMFQNMNGRVCWGSPGQNDGNIVPARNSLNASSGQLHDATSGGESIPTPQLQEMDDDQTSSLGPSSRPPVRCQTSHRVASEKFRSPVRCQISHRVAS